MRLRTLATTAALALPAAAAAGPPFLTDDPEPTNTRHWEIFAPLVEAEGTGSDNSGAVGVELNYGVMEDVQLTIGLPVGYAHSAGRTHWGAGDLEASVKYRFFHDETRGVQIAAFPGITVPTGSNGMSADRFTALLPVWAQKDFGSWSVFGGGGYAINPGPGNRDHWTAGLAVACSFGERVLLGIEADRDGPDQIGGRGTTRLGLGGIYDLPGPLRLLASAGPTLPDTGAAGFHAFLALGLDY